MRQPRTRFFGLAPRPRSGASDEMRAGMLAVVALAIGASIASFTDALHAAAIALHAGGYTSARPPVSLRAARVPEGILVATTDASLLYLSLLILTFIEGAFAWVIVINTGQSVGAAPRAPDMDCRPHRPPKATREPLARALQRRLNQLPHPLRLRAHPLLVRLGLERLPLREHVVGAPRLRLRLPLRGPAEKAIGSVSRRTGRALLWYVALSSAISPIPAFAGARGVRWSVAR